MRPYGIGIVGAGLIGGKRAQALSGRSDSRLVAVADTDLHRAQALAADFGGEATASWEEVVEREDVQIVVVATPNRWLTEVGVAALRGGKHVLCEKPLGRDATESESLVETAAHSGTTLKTGFNHRHHPAIEGAKVLLDQGVIGETYLLRCRYGHGGRPGYEKEWRADRSISGGGELLDQGVHVVDLFRWFGGEFQEVFGYLATYCWDVEVEDNAFALLKGSTGRVAMMHTSWTQWKNAFVFEVFGSEGYLIVDGLGGSYGPEKLRVGRRSRAGGAPAEETTEFGGPDVSWEKEWAEFIAAIRDRREPVGNGRDGHEANRILGAIYEAARIGVPVRLDVSR